MRKPLTPTTNPLLAILRQLGNNKARNQFAELAGTTTSYLYQLATCCRGGTCRVTLAKDIADASVAMNLCYGTPVITMEQIATMCQSCEPKPRRGVMR